MTNKKAIKLSVIAAAEITLLDKKTELFKEQIRLAQLNSKHRIASKR